jgi:phenylacetate-CoA ligase
MISKRSIDLFQQASISINAYRDFLAQQDINPKDIKTPEDYLDVPITDKNNYLRSYPLFDLMWKKDLNRPLLFCSTSGSTGEPYYFPRSEELSQQYSVLIESYLRQSVKKNPKTLVIIGFGMGVWIGGIITLRAFEIAGERMKFPLSLLPTGYNKTEIFKALKSLSPDFDQTILVGYPPFVKEIIDDAKRKNIPLGELNIRLLFAAESFTENFRDYVCEKAGVKNPLLDTLSIYGTADIGAMAYETPLSILIRRLSTKNKKLFKTIFGQIEKTPTLAQYNPDFIEFEEVDNEILLTGNSSLPLIRYAVGDNGGVLSYSEMASIFVENDKDLDKEIKKAGISSFVKKHPFVFVYERKDFSVSLHGINIYPEFVKEALLDKKLANDITERFTMITRYDRGQNQYLEINLELQEGSVPTIDLETLAKNTIRAKLIEKSSEFAEISKTKASEKLLSMAFWPNGHPRYFRPGIKQKWVLEE